MGPFVAHVVMAYTNEAASLAAEAMFQREARAAAVAVVREVDGASAISDGGIVKPLILGEFGARKYVWYGRDPCACCGGSLHPFLDFRGRPFHESGVEGNFTVALCFPVSHASGSNIVPVCLDVDGFVADKGACKHVSRLQRGGVERGCGKGGVSDRESSSLDSIP